MKLYDIELREKSEDFYIYKVIDRNIVSEAHLIPTVNSFLSTRENGTAYVVVSQIEAKI